MFKKILIANRGEIAVRIMKTAKRLGIKTVAVYSCADRTALHVQLADEAFYIGPSPASKSYLCAEKIIDVAIKSGVDAIHPGYGFLSENYQFAELCAAKNIVFIGPSIEAIKAMGPKDEAKDLMERAGVPVVPGYHGQDQCSKFLKNKADEIGYPIMIKAVSGGGGKGLRRVEQSKDFLQALESCQREAKNSFGDDRVILEKFINKPRHIEVQILADTHDNVIHLFERDCSLQRRHQKVLEEAPAPGISKKMRLALGEAAVNAAKSINYQGAGTVEFIVDTENGSQTDKFWFMEMNTRLQVEHPITEMITGLDLVEWQFRIAFGEQLSKSLENLTINGASVEVRIYAEDPTQNFMPTPGVLSQLSFPDETEHLRLDIGVKEGDTITTYYDPLIAKLIVWGENRSEAFLRLGQALRSAKIEGCITNTSFLYNLATNDEVLKGHVHTGLIDEQADQLIHPDAPVSVHILAASFFEYLKLETDVDYQSHPDDPWDNMKGMRVNGKAHSLINIIINDQDISQNVVFDGHSVEWQAEGQRISAKLIARTKNEITIEINGHIKTLTTLSSKKGVLLIQNGSQYKVNFEQTHILGENASDNTNELICTLPGTVVSVTVNPGDQVQKGDVLCAIEAMKMEHSFLAPRSGVVQSVNVEVGQQVAEDYVLVSLKECENDKSER